MFAESAMQHIKTTDRNMGKLWNSNTLDCSTQDLRGQVPDKELAKILDISMTIKTMILTTTTQTCVHTSTEPIHQYTKPCPCFGPIIRRLRTSQAHLR